MKAQRGFTLVEVMVALGIFALIGTACYQFLHSLTVSREVLAGASGNRLSVARAMLIFEQDVRQMIPRSVRVAGAQERVAALSSGAEGVLEFSRGGFPLNRSIYVDGARRVIYQLQEEETTNVLYRVVYEVLDRTEDSPQYSQAMLTGVREIGFRFMDDKGRWQTEWPPKKNSEDEQPGDAKGQATPDLAALPDAIEISLTLDSEDTILRMISLR